VNPEEDPPPETEKPRLVTEGSNEDFRLTITPRGLQLQAPPCRDPHLERYFPFIERLHIRSGSELISGHFLDVALRTYASYRTTCDCFYRRSCWRAIHASLQWLAQRSRRN
jgi:hypothetical protein